MNFWLSLSLVCSFLQPNHAFYVSVTDVAYESTAGLMKIQVKVFTDDLEDAVRNYSDQAINLEDGINSEEEKLVHEYVSSHVQVSIDGHVLDLENASCTREGDAVFSKYTGKVTSKPGNLAVENSLLLQLFPTQTNIVRLLKEEGQGILKLNKQKTEGKLSF